MQAIFSIHLAARRWWLPGVVLCMSSLVVINPVKATTVSATAVGQRFAGQSGSSDHFSQQSQEPSSEAGFLSQEARQPEEAAWMFDLAGDPNFSSFVHQGHPLKSALLTLTVAPEQFQISPDALGLHALTEGNQHKRLNFSVQVEVDLLELYDSDELLDMLASNAGKLQIPYPNPETIAAAQIHLTTDTPETFDLRVLLVFAALLALILVGTSLWWRKKWHEAQATVQVQASQGMALSDAEARMAIVGNMASSIVHDVKNAFTAIRSCAEVIGDDTLDPNDRRDFAQLIVHEIDRGVDMTQELLDFTSGKHRALNMELHGVSQLLEETLTFIRQDLRARQIALHTDFQYPGTLQVDGDKMKRVFLNLITNARDAMPEGGRLTVSSYMKDAQVHLEFSDTGCGMPADLQARMFEPLVTEGKRHGTGLGMAIVKDILEAHQAAIHVQSDVGKGTTICLIFSQEAATDKSGHALNL